MLSHLPALPPPQAGGSQLKTRRNRPSRCSWPRWTRRPVFVHEGISPPPGGGSCKVCSLPVSQCCRVPSCAPSALPPSRPPPARRRQHTDAWCIDPRSQTSPPPAAAGSRGRCVTRRARVAGCHEPSAAPEPSPPAVGGSSPLLRLTTMGRAQPSWLGREREARRRCMHTAVSHG